MIPLLRESWANALQLASLPLEVVGLTLAWIEVRDPVRARRISDVLVALGRVTFPPELNSPDHKVAWRLFIGIEVTLMSLAWVTLFAFIGNFKPRSAPFELFVFGLLLGPIIGSFICFRVVSWLLTALEGFSGGRVLGAFGLILAALGVSGGVYQVAVLLFGRS